MSAKPIEYHKTYFLDEPQRGGRYDYEATLLVREGRGRQQRRTAVSFRGLTRDDADRAMVDWIEQSGAVEANFEAE